MTRKRSVWSIAIYAGASPLRLASPPEISNPVLTRESVRDISASFLADPFMVFHADQWHLFCEVMNRDTGLGEIGLAVSRNLADWQYQRTVLREPFHLSYPHIYRWDGAFYMVPETVWTGAVTAYKATQFPFEWSPAATLLEGTFADPTIFEHHGRCWMFVCSNPRLHDELSLFHATEPLGPWRPHACNPLIRQNPRVARPAGKVLRHEGRLLRLSQDCVPAYGTRVRASEIVELSPDVYREWELPESPILAPDSSWNASGMHHIDAHLAPDGRWIACVDGYRME